MGLGAVLSGALLAAGCGDAATGASDGAAAWHLVEDLRIGSAASGQADEFTRVADVWVDDDLRLWVIDAITTQVRVFDRTGTHVRSVGRKGSGPAELGIPIALERGPRGRIWIADSGNARWAVFDTTGGFVEHHEYAPGMYRFGDRWGSDDLLYTYLSPSTLGTLDFRIVRRALGESGLEPVDTIPTPRLPYGESVPVSFVRDGRRMNMMIPAPFQATGVRLLDAGTGWWVGAPGTDYYVTRQSFSGDTLVRIRRDVTPVPVVQADIDLALGRIGIDELDGGEVPRHHPPFSELWTLPDGHLLVRRASEGGQSIDVFTPAGAYVTTAPLPHGAPLQLFHAGDDALYGAIQDSIGVPYVVRIRIDRR